MDVTPEVPPEHKQRVRRHPLFIHAYRWLQDTTLIPRFLPKSWQRPVIGYLTSLVLQVVAIALIALLTRTFPSFHFLSALILLIVLSVAISWGAGPAIFATLLGVVLLAALLLPQTFSLNVAYIGNIFGILLYLIVGLAIGLIASQTQRARNEAEDARQHLHDLFMQAPAIIAIMRGPEHRFTLANPLYLKTWGSMDIIGRTVQEALPEVIQQEYMQYLDEVYSTGRPFVGTELPIQIDRQGNGTLEKGYVNIVFQPSRTADGKIDGILLHGVDVTEQVQARKRIEELVSALEVEREALKESEERARLIADLTSDYAYAYRVLSDGSFEREWLIGAFTRMTGYTPQELDEIGWEEHFYYSEDKALVDAQYAELLAGVSGIHELRICTKSGEILWQRDYSRAVLDPKTGDVRWVYGAVQDITARKQAEIQVKQQANQLEAIINAVPDALYFTNRFGKNVRMNAAGQTLLSLNRRSDVTWEGEALGNYLDVRDEYGNPLPTEQWPSTRILRGEVLSADTSTELILRSLDGHDLFVSMTGGPVFDTNQQITGAVTLIRDVTERHNLEQRMLSSEQDADERARQLEAVFEAMTDGVMVYDATGHVLRMNTAYRKLIALDTRPEHSNLTPGERGAMLALRDEQGNALPGKKQPVQRMLSGEVLVGDRALDIQVRALNGREVQLNTTGTPMYDQNKNLTGGVLIFRDVTDRRILERRTQETLEALLTMATTLVKLPDPYRSTQQQGIASKNTAQQLIEIILRVLGCKRVSLTAIDSQRQAYLPLAVAGLSSEQEQNWRQRLPGATLHDLLVDAGLAETLQTDDVLVLDFSKPPLSEHSNIFGIQVMVLLPMKIGSRLIGMLALDHGSENHIYTERELTLAKATADLAALVLEYERLLAERAEAEANELAAREATRLMEEFIGIAGHELRTPLTTIKASVQLAKRQLNRMLKHEEDLPTRVTTIITNIQELLNRTERQVAMQNRLVNDLLDVSRIQAGHLELHPELCDLVSIVHQCVEDQFDLTPSRGLSLEVANAKEILVFADADRLRQVITNYLSNALKYSEGDKPVVVHVKMDGNWGRVLVKDEGPGLTENQQQRIWERFYRVPDVEVKSGSGVGLGLGLHISRMIIEQQGGRVGVQSTQGQGSTFWFSLPLAEK